MSVGSSGDRDGWGSLRLRPTRTARPGLPPPGIRLIRWPLMGSLLSRLVVLGGGVWGFTKETIRSPSRYLPEGPREPHEVAVSATRRVQPDWGPSCPSPGHGQHPTPPVFHGTPDPT